MAIKPPAWAKDAVPTPKGWKHPRRNEILLPRKFTQDQIDEYLGVSKSPPLPPEPPPVQEDEIKIFSYDLNDEEHEENDAWDFLIRK